MTVYYRILYIPAPPDSTFEILKIYTTPMQVVFKN